MKRLSNRGDAIIEVLLAMALLTSVLFIAWSVTNRATQTLAAARDRTVMVNALKEQAETIKVLWQDDTKYFNNETAYPKSTDLQAEDPCVEPGGNLWHLAVNPDTGVITRVAGARTVGGNDDMRVWVQKVESTVSGELVYNDFYIRGCWNSRVVGGQRSENSQFIVRLNT